MKKVFLMKLCLFCFLIIDSALVLAGEFANRVEVLVNVNWGQERVVISNSEDEGQVLLVFGNRSNGEYGEKYKYQGQGEIVALINGWGDENGPFVVVWMTGTGYRVSGFVKDGDKIMQGLDDGSEIPPEFSNTWKNDAYIANAIVVTQIGWVVNEQGGRTKRPLKKRTYEWLNSSFRLKEALLKQKLNEPDSNIKN